MSDIEQRLREAMDDVTPGPWKLHGTLSIDCEIGARKNPAIAICMPNFVQDGSVYANAAYIALCSPDNIGALLDERAADRATIASLRSKLEEAEGARPKNIEKTADQLAVSLGFLIRDWLTGPKPLEGDKLEYIIKMRIRRLLTEAALASLREADHA